MGDYATKRLQVLKACEKVINGIEGGQITTSSALLLCKKIARLVNDVEGQEWLSYEYGGYPTTKDVYITDESWRLAVRHGRSFYNSMIKKKNFEFLLIWQPNLKNLSQALVLH